MDKEWVQYFRYVKHYYDVYRRWPTKEVLFPGDEPLGKWCHQQRQLLKEKKLDPKKAKKLLEIGFSFSTMEDKWGYQHTWLQEFKEQFKRVPGLYEQYPPGNFLGEWCQEQRLSEKQLSSIKKQKLQKIDKNFFKEFSLEQSFD